jgi:DNA replication protein DnaC
VQAIEHHKKRTRFFSTVELVNALEQEKAQGKAGQIAGRLGHVDLVILDSCGVGSYVELPHEVGL